MTKIFWCNIVSRDFKLNTAVIDRGQALYFLSITKGIFPCNRCFIYPIKIKCAGLRWKNLAPWKLEYFSFFFYLSPRSAGVCYRKCCRFLLPQQSFSKWNKDRGGSLGLSSEEGESTIHFWRIFYKLGIKKVKMEKRARKKIETDSTRKRL